VISGDERAEFPASIGGLVDLAFAAYFERAQFYVILAAIAFAVQAIIEFVAPAYTTNSAEGQLKYLIIEYAGLVVDSYIVTAVALGIGSRLADDQASSRTLARAVLARWLPVFIIGVLTLLVSDTTFQYNGFGPLPDTPWLVVLTAPIMWLVFGVLGIAGPIAALSAERPGMAMIAGLTRAVAFSMQPGNFGRLCVVTFATIIPALLQTIVVHWLLQHNVARPLFWGNIPIDALTVGPIAALQTVFALDFARRAGALGRPRR
jgi:hypothetical protein